MGVRTIGWHRGVIAASLVLAVPWHAHAHLVTTGAGPFYDGAVHFFVSLEELLPVLALALFAGLRGPHVGRWVLAILPMAWVVGGMAGLSLPIDTPPAAATTLLLLVPGALLAADWELPLAPMLALAALFGLLTGFFNGTAMAAGGLGVLGIAGATTAALLVATLSAALAVSLRHGWTRTAIRVAGSWIAALGVLALGWSLRR
jgi:urease accessory protein